MKYLHHFTLASICLMPTYVLAKSHKRPNILFILSDDHAMPAISAYNSTFAEIAPTPNLDRIAEGGTLFNHMFVTNSISGPSRAALITGKFSTTNGFYQNEGGISFDGSQPTTAKMLQAAGYATSLFGKWHLNSTPTGFDHYMIHADPSGQGKYWNPPYDINGELTTLEGYSTNVTTNEALIWLEKQQTENKPFCMMLHYKAPHRPCDPDTTYLDYLEDVTLPYPETFNDDYKTRENTIGVNMAKVAEHFTRTDVKMPVPPGFSEQQANSWLKYGDGIDQNWTPDQTMTPQEVKEWKYQQYYKNYLRCIKSVDDNVGRVLDYLKETGQYDNTIIIYMGDQGFFLGEHGIYDKRWMYEESIHMPCLFSYPNAKITNKPIEQLAMNVDIAPTLLDYAGIKIPKDMHGESLRPLLEQGNKEPKWRKSVYYQYFEYPKWHMVQPHYGVRTERYKLIHYYYNIDQWEFFDLEADPNELNNSYDNPAYAAIINDLKKEIKTLQKKYDDEMTLEERRKYSETFRVNYE